MTGRLFQVKKIAGLMDAETLCKFYDLLHQGTVIKNSVALGCDTVIGC
jgi:hypothetical protein